MFPSLEAARTLGLLFSRHSFFGCKILDAHRRSPFSSGPRRLVSWSTAISPSVLRFNNWPCLFPHSSIAPTHPTLPPHSSLPPTTRPTQQLLYHPVYAAPFTLYTLELDTAGAELDSSLVIDSSVTVTFPTHFLPPQFAPNLLTLQSDQQIPPSTPPPRHRPQLSTVLAHQPAR
ncbi:unnamed protein product [Cutaneotrichosporon oleaginosum]